MLQAHLTREENEPSVCVYVCMNASCAFVFACGCKVEVIIIDDNLQYVQTYLSRSASRRSTLA